MLNVLVIFSISLIYYAFLYFLIRCDVCHPTEKQKSKLIKDFSLSKLKKEVDFYDKEKSGMNLNILLIEILILIIEKKHDELSDRYEAIQKYVQRYIDDSESQSRIKLMFKLLLLCIKHNFKRSKIEESVSQTLEYLQEQHRELGDEAYELEIIPYEVEWLSVLKFMK